MDRHWFIHSLLLLISCSTFQTRTLIDHLREPTNSTNAPPFLVTKPNSYLYDGGDDDEEVLNRVKRDPAPFVCKSKRRRSFASIKNRSSVLADGYFPDRHNCRVYHICTSGVDTISVCAEGTSWDPEKKNCAWENTVECRKGLRKWDQITDIRGGRKDPIISPSEGTATRPL